MWILYFPRHFVWTPPSKGRFCAPITLPPKHLGSEREQMDDKLKNNYHNPLKKTQTNGTEQLLAGKQVPLPQALPVSVPDTANKSASIFDMASQSKLRHMPCNLLTIPADVFPRISFRRVLLPSIVHAGWQCNRELIRLIFSGCWRLSEHVVPP